MFFFSLTVTKNHDVYANDKNLLLYSYSGVAVSRREGGGKWKVEVHLAQMCAAPRFTLCVQMHVCRCTSCLLCVRAFFSSARSDCRPRQQRRSNLALQLPHPHRLVSTTTLVTSGTTWILGLRCTMQPRVLHRGPLSRSGISVKENKLRKTSQSKASQLRAGGGNSLSQKNLYTYFTRKRFPPSQRHKSWKTSH